ncbi:hypothetical protein GCM10027427_35130 [Pseudoclavibacter terrae]
MLLGMQTTFWQNLKRECHANQDFLLREAWWTRILGMQRPILRGLPEFRRWREWLDQASCPNSAAHQFLLVTLPRRVV